MKNSTAQRDISKKLALQRQFFLLKLPLDERSERFSLAQASTKFPSVAAAQNKRITRRRVQLKRAVRQTFPNNGPA